MKEGRLYLDRSAPLELRVRDLMGRMNGREKLAQLGSVWAPKLFEGGSFSHAKAEEMIGDGIGQVSRLAGSQRVSARSCAHLANQIQRFLIEETRLGIPAIIHEECLSGMMAMDATTFPQAIGLASTWDPELVSQVTSAIRGQMRAAGSHQGLAPVLDVARDPRWGRTEESFGEDPYLVTTMGVAYVRGLQGAGLRSGIAATAKHFAGHGFSEGGRALAPVHVALREMKEVYLLPFEAAVKQGRLLSVMNAYHDIDGIPCASSRELLTNTLRGEWGFDGIVVSDYGSIQMLETFHKTAKDKKEAARQALEAGIDIELENSVCYGEPLSQALDEASVSGATVDVAVSRVLRAKFALGLFDDPYADEAEARGAFDNEENRALALRAARESIVLLKNDGVLPLGDQVRSIVVVGPSADSTRNLLGDYSYTAHLRLDRAAIPVISVLAGIKGRAPPKTEVHYAKGCELAGGSAEDIHAAVEVAERSDVIVAVVGERSGLSEADMSGEGRDRHDLSLPGVQEALIKELSKTDKPMIVVLVNGRPLTIGSVLAHCSAVIEAWLPGEEGGNAIADVLFGRHNPAGRLPVTFPVHVGQVPLNYARRPSSFRDYVFLSSDPLFPFGHGLSYTRFEYGDLRISPTRVAPAGSVEASFTLTNAGDREGDEVVQLYVRDEVSSVSRPVKELKGFKRVGLKPGEKKSVRFRIASELLAFYDQDMRLVVEPGRFDLMVGASSDDIRLTGEFEVVGNAKVVPSREVFFSDATAA